MIARCPNGHAMPRVVAVPCSETDCGAAVVYEPTAQGMALDRALRELVDAGEPFIGDAFPSEEMTGNGLRLFNRWMAAMTDARTALEGQ